MTLKLWCGYQKIWRVDDLWYARCMQLPIKRIDTTLPLPEYKTQGAVAFDLSARLETTILPGKVGFVPLNVVIAVPPGYMLLLAARSSLQKRGVMMANGVGVIDEDYCGDTDEINAALYNFSDTAVVVPKGDRIVQGIILPIEKVEWQECVHMQAPSRGGFGTTGTT